MTSLVRRVSAAVLLLAGALAASMPASAQELQSGKPIRIIVGLAAGGGTDVMARLIAQKMGENMKATVIVENKAGGNFIPALKELTGSPADGHTLFFISTSTLITQPLHPDYPFDLTKLAPITEVATGPLIMVVKNELGVKTLKDFIDLAKKNPGKLTFGAGGGTGSSLDFATELLKSKPASSINIVQLPRRGSGAQRSARRPHRRHVRRHAGDVGAGQGRQSHADRGHQRQALGGAARCRRPSRSPALRTYELYRLVRHSRARPARRRRSCRSSATRSRRPLPTRASSRR